MYKTIIKPTLDLVLSFFLLILVSPVLLFVTFILLFSNRGKVFFIQRRPGKDEKVFNLIKFKTMNDEKDKDGNLLPDDVRITKTGKMIRKFSLDELLQLINVLNGNMSLIGPRPLLVEYLPLYNNFQKRRHDAKPGITGWAQVNGRNTISWQEKFEYDVWYVENLSFYVDIKIFLMTIIKILKRNDINSDTSVTMDKFTGTTK